MATSRARRFSRLMPRAMRPPPTPVLTTPEKLLASDSSVSSVRPEAAFKPPQMNQK